MEKKTFESMPKEEKKKNRLFNLLFIISILMTIITVVYYLMSLLSFLAGGIAVIVIGGIIVIIVCATLFLILLSEDFRRWVGKAWKIPEYLIDASEHLAETSKYFLHLAIPTLILIGLGLTFSIIGKVKKGNYLFHIIAYSILLVLVVLTIILYFANGSKILGA